jgi:hypothetical protein
MIMAKLPMALQATIAWGALQTALGPRGQGGRSPKASVRVAYARHTSRGCRLGRRRGVACPRCQQYAFPAPNRMMGGRVAWHRCTGAQPHRAAPIARGRGISRHRPHRPECRRPTYPTSSSYVLIVGDRHLAVIQPNRPGPRCESLFGLAAL